MGNNLNLKHEVEPSVTYNTTLSNLSRVGTWIISVFLFQLAKIIYLMMDTFRRWSCFVVALAVSVSCKYLSVFGPGKCHSLFHCSFVFKSFATDLGKIYVYGLYVAQLHFSNHNASINITYLC